MIRRMLFVALLLGVPTAFADGLGVSPGLGVSAYARTPAAAASQHALVVGNMKPLFRALLFGRNYKYDRPHEEGEITF